MSLRPSLHIWGPATAWPYPSGVTRCEGLCLKCFSPKWVCEGSFSGEGGSVDGGGFVLSFFSLLFILVLDRGDRINLKIFLSVFRLPL